MIVPQVSRRRLLLGALALPASLGGCVVAPYGTYYRPASDDPRAVYKRGWCQGQAGPTTRIELAIEGSVTIAARAERDFTERQRTELPLRVTVTLPAAPARFEGRTLQIVADGKAINAAQTVRAFGGATVAADAWVEATRLRPAGPAGVADKGDAPFGRAFFRFIGPAGFAPESMTLSGPAVQFDDGRLPFPAVELRRPASASSPDEYRSAAEQADLEARAAACRRDTPQRACQNIVDFGASRSFAFTSGPLQWQGRWLRYARSNGEARVDGDLVLAMREPRRWRPGSAQATLRGDGAEHALGIAQFEVRFVDRIALDTPLHAGRADGRTATTLQIEALLPDGLPDFELRLPPLQTDGRRVTIAPIRFERRSLDGGIEPFNC